MSEESRLSRPEYLDGERIYYIVNTIHPIEGHITVDWAVGISNEEAIDFIISEREWLAPYKNSIKIINREPISRKI